ncbi:MAG: nucleotidyltransferase domain-containing protein, partial [Planctomycetes bacterium]|nr:nucleotidyltransferase domain-containing protein [Planctomycetota bacterium]
MIAPRIREPVTQFRSRVERLYGKRLKEVVLYGSWARGDATDDSDIDLLVVLEGEVAPGREVDRMIDVITEIGLEYGVLVSVYPVSS